MNVSRKRKKELRKLQDQATTLWESQQVLLGQAGDIAREAGRQLGNFTNEQVAPVVQEKYTQGLNASRRLYNSKVVPAAGAVVGSALSVWDAANDTRHRIAEGRGLGAVNMADFQKRAAKYSSAAAKRIAVAEPTPKRSAGGVIALILGLAAAAGVLYAAWQTLRADDELWVADDPLAAPEN